MINTSCVSSRPSPAAPTFAAGGMPTPRRRLSLAAHRLPQTSICYPAAPIAASSPQPRRRRSGAGVPRKDSDMFDQHPDVVRVFVKDRQSRVRDEFRDAHDAKVARRARRRAR